ncbi:putative uncharacterized protein [Clostridium sp. CAG:567]|jgi:hypothetical protein|nr:putative uncharacterized protein [Clostridium sp. CAG:567]
MNKVLEKINNEQLQLIPKVQEYIQYMLETLLKLPRTEKFSIGNEYKSSMYKLLEYILYVSKIEKEQRLECINKIDAELNCQRIYLRIMYKNRWINDKKFNVAITKIGEIGKMVGGLVKYYVKNNKE